MRRSELLDRPGRVLAGRVADQRTRLTGPIRTRSHRRHDHAQLDPACHHVAADCLRRVAHCPWCLFRLREAAPGLEAWLRIVFTVMGGFMAGAGVLTIFVARLVVPARVKCTGWAVALAGLPTVVLMSAMNFALDSDFRWVLLLPALLWAAAVIAYARRG